MIDYYIPVRVVEICHITVFYCIKRCAMKKMTVLSAMLLFAVFFALHCSDKSAEQKQNSARLIFSIGDVQVKESEAWNPAAENMILYQGNEIKTGPASQCNIVIGDSSFVSVKENSHLLLESLFRSAEGSESSTLQLQVGKSVINPKKLLKGDQFRVKTPTAIAAVRGTKFIVESRPEGNMKVSVVDGKVELQRRIPALEEVEEKIISRSEALASLKEKVELEKLVVEINESAYIDNRKAERENREIEKIITRHVEEIRQVEEIESLKQEKDKTVSEIQEKKTRAIETFKVKDVEVKEVLADFEIMRRKEQEPVQIKIEKKVEVADVAAVKELDMVIEEVKEKEKQAEQPAGAEVKAVGAAELLVSSPHKRSAIYLNDKFMGHDTVRYRPEPGSEIRIRISVEGYEDFNKTVSCREGEKLSVKPEFTESPRVTVVSPVKNSSIFIDSKFVGTDEVTAPVKAGKKSTVMVKARGFKPFTREIELKLKETATVTAEMERIVALDRVKWMKSVRSNVSVKPVFESGLIVCAMQEGSVIAMNSTGIKIWEMDLKRRIESTPVAHGGSVYIVTNSGDLYSLSVAGGSINWKKKIEGSLLFGSQPVIEKNTIYVATSFGKVYALKTDGTEIWQADIENGVYSSPAVGKGVVYVGAEDQNVYALSAEKGNIKWAFRVDGRIVSAAPVISGNGLYVACYTGSIYAIDAAEGRQLWKFSAGDAILSTPVVSGGSVYFGSNDGYFYALSTASGKLAWKNNLGDRITTQPEISGRTIFVTSGKNLYSLDMDSGAELWRHVFEKSIKTSATLVGNDLIMGVDGGDVAAVRNSLVRALE